MLPVSWTILAPAAIANERRCDVSPIRPKPYTEPANHLLTLASQVSANLRAGYTGTEHLLLALLLFKESGAYKILQMANIEEQDVQKRLKNLMIVHEAGDHPIPSTRPTDEVNKVLSDAIIEAEELGFPYIASEQILVAILKQPETIAGRVLHDLGLNFEKGRSIVRSMHSLPESI